MIGIGIGVGTGPGASRGEPAPITENILLTESGDFMVLEDGVSNLLIEG